MANEAAKKSTAKKKAGPKSKAALNAERKLKEKVSAIVREREDFGADLEVTEASEWKGKLDLAGTKLPLPSGNVCLIRNPGLGVFIEQGLIPNSLLPIVEKAIGEGKGIAPKQAKELAADPEMLKDMGRLTNEVVCYCVLKPVVLPVPTKAQEDDPEPERDPNALYVDELDLTDKMFIFQWVVGGTRDTERFREQSADAVAALADVADVDDSAE